MRGAVKAALTRKRFVGLVTLAAEIGVWMGWLAVIATIYATGALPIGHGVEGAWAESAVLLLFCSILLLAVSSITGGLLGSGLFAIARSFLYFVLAVLIVPAFTCA